MKYTSMAFQMIGAILVLVFLGRYLDKNLSKNVPSNKSGAGFPLFTFLGTIMGVAASLYLALKSLKK